MRWLENHHDTDSSHAENDQLSLARKQKGPSLICKLEGLLVHRGVETVKDKCAKKKKKQLENKGNTLFDLRLHSIQFK